MGEASALIGVFSKKNHGMEGKGGGGALRETVTCACSVDASDENKWVLKCF